MKFASKRVLMLQRSNQPSVQKFTALTTTAHEDYTPNHKTDWDIAVIRLHSALTFNDYVQPICLPSHAVADNTNCVVTGWGYTRR